MLADIRRRFMPKEAIFFPDFPAPDEGNGFAIQPDTGNLLPTSPSYCLPPTSFRCIFTRSVAWIVGFFPARFTGGAETGSTLGVRKHMRLIIHIEINRIGILCSIVGWA